MLDTRLRPFKDRALRPIVLVLAPRVAPIAASAFALAAGLAAAGSAAAGAVGWSLVWWWTSRIADGLDGALARARGSSSDLGGFADLVGDVVVYAAVPLGIAVAVADARTWAAAAVLLAAFYVNVVAWLFLSAAMNGRGTAGAAASTSIPIPPGLVEGAETLVLYTVMLAVPGKAAMWFWLMAALVAITVGQRAVSARSMLG